MSSLARRYAQATLEAVGAHAADQVTADFERLALLVEQNASMRDLIHNPQSLDVVPQTIAALVTRFELMPEAGRLFAMLVANDRASLLNEVAQAMRVGSDQRAGRKRAFVRSATPLSNEQTARLKKSLEAQLGQPVALVFQIDSQLLGGLVCQVDALTFDMSLTRQLATAADELGRPTTALQASVSPREGN